MPNDFGNGHSNKNGTQHNRQSQPWVNHRTATSVVVKPLNDQGLGERSLDQPPVLSQLGGDLAFACLLLRPLQSLTTPMGYLDQGSVRICVNHGSPFTHCEPSRL